jgi:hypothetical protein
MRSDFAIEGMLSVKAPKEDPRIRHACWADVRDPLDYYHGQQQATRVSIPAHHWLWIPVLLLGAALRFLDLSSAPLHADEAVGAKITAARLESRG